jgi:hypothetical protein
MTSTQGEGDRIDPDVSGLEDLDQTDVEGSIERDPGSVPNADYSDPDTRPAVAPDDDKG